MNCSKCGYNGEDVRLYNIDKLDVILCDICKNYAPDNSRLLKIYLNEKIDGIILDTFRKARISIADRTKKGMLDKAISGETISKPPKGYKIINKKLVIDEQNSIIIKAIFNEYLESDNSLSWFAKKYNLTTSGLIKILKNPTYTGMIKIKDNLIKGNHEAIISNELFDNVQKKISK
ncbi:MAG TPA: recombinase family protein [Alphaproteobacteria bacterium]|nr:recombinase family protein [Alphaproteobacteria bacterium]